MYRVSQLAALLGGQVEGDGNRWLTGVASLEDATPDQLSFLANSRYHRAMQGTHAGAVLIGLADDAVGHTIIRCQDPYAAFARSLRLFNPEPAVAAGIDPRAVVEGEAGGAKVMAFAYVGPGAKVGDGTVLQPFSYVGANATVGRDCRLMPGSVVMDGCVLGDRVVLNPGAVVGGEGFGFAPTPSGLLKIPQVGIAVLEDDVELGANTCVDRAALGETRIGKGTKMDNLVQVGHAAQLGSHCTLVAFAGVAGSARVGNAVVLAAGAKVLGHFEVGDGTRVGAMSLLTHQTPARSSYSGIPAVPHSDWLNQASSLPRLAELLERVRTLEAQVQDLQTRLRPGGSP